LIAMDTPNGNTRKANTSWCGPDESVFEPAIRTNHSRVGPKLEVGAWVRLVQFR
jgi:hypothetical protein